MDINRKIADSLTAGMTCYFHKTTKRIIEVPANLGEFDDHYEFWQKDLESVESHPAEYITFEPPSSREMFEIMEEFSEQVEQHNLREALFRSLGNRKPFRHFNTLVHEVTELRDPWFAFRLEAVERRVERRMSFMLTNE